METLVKKLNPLTIFNNFTSTKTVISEEIFQNHFYISFAVTSHRVQGETINEPFNIWEWNKMSNRAKYTSTSRTTSKDLINIIDEKEAMRKDIPDTSQIKLTRNDYNRKRLENPLEQRRD